MKVTFATLILIILVVQTGIASKLKPFEPGDKLKTILKDIIVQGNITGFTVFTTLLTRNPILFEKYTQVLKQISSMTAISSIDYLYLQQILTFTKIFPTYLERKEEATKKWFQSVTITDTRCLLVISVFPKYNFKRNFDFLHAFITSVYFSFSSKVTTPRILFVFIVESKIDRYDSLLKGLWQNRVSNIAILEISKNESTVNFDYRVFTYNPFINVVFSSDYNSKVKWFPDHVANLQEYNFFVQNIIAKSFPSLHILYKRQLEIPLKKLNGSFVYVEDAKWDICSILSEAISLSILDCTYIYSVDSKSSYLRVPVLNDENRILQFNTFIYNFLALVSIVAICWIWTLAFQQLNPIIIFSMTIGAIQMRRPRTIAEFFLFAILLFIGLFFASELISAMTSITITETKEIDVQNLKDIEANNLSVYALYFQMGLNKMSKIYNASNVKYINDTTKNMFQDMLLYKNASVSPISYEAFGIQIPERIVVNRKVLVKTSNVKDMSSSLTWIFHQNAPWLNHISLLLLQVFEYSLNINNFTTDTILRKYYYDQVGKYVEELEEETLDGEYSLTIEDLGLGSIWIILVFGSALAFIAMGIEIIFAKCTRGF